MESFPRWWVVNGLLIFTAHAIASDYRNGRISLTKLDFGKEKGSDR